MAENNAHLPKAAITEHLISKPMSLADLQAATGFSLPTIRRAVQELSQAGWVCPKGQMPSTGGRPATLYGLNADSHLVIGVHVEIPSVNLVLAALDGSIIDYAHFSREDGLLPDDALRCIVDFTQAVRKRYPERSLQGIGMAAPGYVDAASGTILMVGRAEGWRNYPMRTRLEAALGLPLTMENDTDCLIHAELANTIAGATADSGDMVYLGVLEGVKVSMWLNGQIYRGPFSNAGLIGRTNILVDRASAHKGRFRELEETTSVGGLCNGFDQRLADLAEEGTALGLIREIADHVEKFHAILEAAEAGEPLCRDIVDEMFADLSLAVSNLIYVLQPTVLVIGGALSNLPPGLSAQLETEIRSKLPSLLSNHLIVRPAAMTGRYAAAMGAAHWFLHEHVTTGTAFEAVP